jgi:GMP synthase (glutamine-hydrolysing)
MSANMVLILDFGSQYTQLIARSIRSLNVYCEIHPYNVSPSTIRALGPRAIILSGSPFSVNQADAPKPDAMIWDLDIPILGICYGMQLITDHFGGKVVKSDKKEYGHAIVNILNQSNILGGLSEAEQVWMSHGDAVIDIPSGFVSIANTTNSPNAAIANDSKHIYAIQFHPEVVNTPCGLEIFRNFLFNITGMPADWTAGSFIHDTVEHIRSVVGTEQVILGLSGGVDSSVAAALLYKAIGKQLIPIFVDTGCMRYQESVRVQAMFTALTGFEILYVDAADLFMKRLEGVSNPEEKRKIIGATFIEVFDQEASRYPNVSFLAQGTLYPDVIESVSFKGPSATIKSHHNVGGLPEKMNMKLIEPLRELFKDEVRNVGRELGLSNDLIRRHPFPGPGLAVRIIGDVTPEKVSLLQAIDEIFINELHTWNLYDSTWQAFAVLLPIQSVGVMGDERTYDNVCALRAVNSVDGMTADWTELPYEFLKRVSNRIINEVVGINRVVYDISSKPPATIEWE